MLPLTFFVHGKEIQWTTELNFDDLYQTSNGRAETARFLVNKSISGF